MLSHTAQSVMSHVQGVLSRKKRARSSAYRLVGVEAGYRESGEIVINVQQIGEGELEHYPVETLYDAAWLQRFSKSDVTHIAALHAAQRDRDWDLADTLPKQLPKSQINIMIVGAIFTACLIVSNLTSVKLSLFGPFDLPAGMMFFPFTFVFDDILTEVYGFKVSRRMIWTAMAANGIVELGTYLAVHTTPSHFWHGQAAYAQVFGFAPRVFFASMVAYLTGEFLNSIVLAKMKVATNGRLFALRILASTATGVTIDSLIYGHLALVAQMPYTAALHTMMVVIMIKFGYEICALPVTYQLSKYLKYKDHVDHYDRNTSFNPFSLAMD